VGSRQRLQYTANVDPNTGRPDTQIQRVIASYQLVELATDKTVLRDSSTANIDYDILGSQQPFAGSVLGATPKIAQSRCLPTLSATGWPHTSLRGRDVVTVPRLPVRYGRPRELHCLSAAGQARLALLSERGAFV
jgi:hypothetical protein